MVGAADIETLAQSGSGVRDLRDMTLAELEQVVSGAGEAPYRVRQVMRWLWVHDARSADVMRDVPARLRQHLKQHFSIGCLSLSRVARAADGTRKLLLRLDDGTEIESVIIPTTDDRTTLCISSQAGCAMGCQFCATARMGLHRNLAAGDPRTDSRGKTRMCEQRASDELCLHGYGRAAGELRAACSSLL